MDRTGTILNLISIWLVTIGVLVAFFAIIQSFSSSANFKVGDCVARVHNAGEFTPREISPLFDKIIKVGKKSYLLEEYYVSDVRGVILVDKELRESSINYIDKSNVQVDCKTGEEL